MSHMCPNCGTDIEDSFQEICPNCKFNFGETLSCGYNINGNCVHTQRPCEMSGLDFEDCKLYLVNTGILKD